MTCPGRKKESGGLKKPDTLFYQYRFKRARINNEIHAKISPISEI